MNTDIKVYIWPFFRDEDQGDGGVRRVVEGQIKHLSEFGVEVVSDPDEADVLACHITAPRSILSQYHEKPLVAHCHGLYWGEYDWWDWAIQANRDVMELIRQADAVTAPSEWVAQIIRRHTLRRAEPVYHGVDTEEWTPGKHKGYVLWNKTRQDPICDPEPMQKVAQLLPHVQFISTIGKETDNVEIIGRHPYAESVSYVREAGIYLATTRETLGIGTLEALACGVPVVGWDWGGNSELLTHKVHGWLARPGDVAGLAEGIEWTLENRPRLKKACRDRAIEFSWDRATKQYADIYGKVYDTRVSGKKKTEISRPRVSVIVTAYKLEEYLDACLNSVAASTYKDFECIVVDDASPDRCGEIADTWAKNDKRFRIIRNTENQYLAGARNTGIRSALGRYILPLDADDRLAPNAIELLAEALDKDRSIHIAYGNVLFVDPDGKEWNSGWPIEYDFDHHIYRERNLLPYASMFRKEVWENTGGYRTRLKTGEDADFWMRAASYGFRPKMVTTSDTLIYTNREGSMSRTETARLWPQWYPWIRRHELTPAGAVTGEQMPVPSLDPPIINVVIPCGPGHEKHLMTAIDSVDAQTFRNFACTVINDTGMSFDFPIPAWVKVLGPYSENLGPARSRNEGIRASRAKLFLPLDADDYLQPHALQVMYNIWLQEKKIVYGDFYEDPDEEGKFKVFQCDDFDDGVLLRHCLHPVTALTPKEWWEAVGGYDANLKAWEDWGFQLACAEKCFCSIHVPVPLFTYRKHTGKRRDQNYRDFEEGKASILEKFGEQYWKGKPLMACGSCGARRANMPAASVQQPLTMRSGNPPGDAVKVFNPSAGGAGVGYKAPSGHTYRFSGKNWQYVLASDVDFFTSRGFLVHDDSGAVNEETLLAVGNG